jgi:hypothetical protein
MKLFLLIGLFLSVSLPGTGQQIIYGNLQDLICAQGDTLSSLKIEKRSKNQLMLTGGADYRIQVDNNSGLSRYLKSRCYAVRVDSALYINCRKVHYKNFTFGGWYAPALLINGKIYFSAQPLGSVAASTANPPNAPKLGGDVGRALAASGLIHARVYYEITPETNKVEFVGTEKMLELLEERPQLRENFLNERSEMAEVTGKYLRQLGLGF